MSKNAFCISWSNTRVVLRSNKQSKIIFFKYSCLLKYTTHGAFCKKRLICTYSCCNSRGMLTVQTLRYVISLLLLNEPSVKKGYINFSYRYMSTFTLLLSVSLYNALPYTTSYEHAQVKWKRKPCLSRHLFTRTLLLQ